MYQTHPAERLSSGKFFTLKMRIFTTVFLLLYAINVQRLSAQTPFIEPPFNFKKCLYTEKRTLSCYVAALDGKSGDVVLNGYDSRRPSYLTFDWGDGGRAETGLFEMRHRYSSTTRNYIASVIADYGAIKDTVKTLIRFLSPLLDRMPISSSFDVTVSIAASSDSLYVSSRMQGYETPQFLPFPDSAFTTVSLKDIEYVLTVAAKIQLEVADCNVERVNGGFAQFILYDPLLQGGMISKWYTSPVTFQAGLDAFRQAIAWSSLFHEMGHNVTLNFPEEFRFGGRIDGNANALYSETMAQIYQHATVFEIVNGYDKYGLSDDIAFEIAWSGLSSMRVLRNAYLDYVKGGQRFFSWNDPSTTEDETFGSFMTLAAVFVEEAEKRNDYRTPLQRMMNFLGKFDPELHEKYDQTGSGVHADTFRATYMAAAVSYGMDQDLRSRFKALNFPISNETYSWLMESVGVLSPQSGRQRPGPQLRSHRGRAVTSVKGAETMSVYGISGRRMPGAQCYSDINSSILKSPSLPCGVYVVSTCGNGGKVVKVAVPWKLSSKH